MRHLREIESYVDILLRSSQFHSLAVLGPSGVGKTTSVTDGLRKVGREAVHVGSYSTPLALYNAMLANRDPDSIVLLDDTAGLLHSPVAMSLLCAAGCPGSSADAPRVVRWGSTAAKVEVPEFTFAGKVILLTNFLPDTPQSRAFQSRALVLRVELKAEEVAEVLESASGDERRFPDRSAARGALDFVLSRLEGLDLAQVSLRTLMQVYEFATLGGERWEGLAEGLLPRKQEAIVDPKKVVEELSAAGGSVKDQEAKFMARTGLGRRTFYSYRDGLGLEKITHKSKSQNLHGVVRQ